MRSPFLLLLWGAILAPLFAAGTAKRADACTLPPPVPELKGYPGKNATEVPLDALPIYTAIGLSAPAVYFLRAGAENVDFTVEPLTWGGSRWTVLRPSAPLKPSTFYVLQGVHGNLVFDVVQFTTGTTAVTPPAAPPSVFMHHWELRGIFTTCSPSRTGTCVALPADQMVEASYVDLAGNESPLWLGIGPFYANLSGIDQGHGYSCIKLRTRARNGTFSEPSTLCGAEAPLSVITTSDRIGCSPAGLTVDGLVVNPDGGPPTTPPEPPADGGSDAGTYGYDGDVVGCACSVLHARGHSATGVAAAMTLVVALGASARRRLRRR